MPSMMPALPSGCCVGDEAAPSLRPVKVPARTRLFTWAGIGIVFGSLIHSVSRNPSLSKQLFGYAILGFALSEAMALFALLVAFLILFGLIGFAGSCEPSRQCRRGPRESSR